MVAESWLFPEDWYRPTVTYFQLFITKFQNLDLLEKLFIFQLQKSMGQQKELSLKTIISNLALHTVFLGLQPIKFVNYYLNLKKFPVIITRASNVYGEYQRLYRIIPKTIFSISKNKKINLHGGGKSKRNFIHIDDVSKALLILFRKGVVGETYHISSKKIISIKDLVKLVGSKFNKELSHITKISKDRIGKDNLYNLNSNKLKKLGWKPEISLDKGINRVAEWISKKSSILKKRKGIL